MAPNGFKGLDWLAQHVSITGVYCTWSKLGEAREAVHCHKSWQGSKVPRVSVSFPVEWECWARAVMEWQGIEQRWSVAQPWSWWCVDAQVSFQLGHHGIGSFGLWVGSPSWVFSISSVLLFFLTSTRGTFWKDINVWAQSVWFWTSLAWSHPPPVLGAGSAAIPNPLMGGNWSQPVSPPLKQPFSNLGQHFHVCAHITALCQPHLMEHILWDPSCGR